MKRWFSLVEKRFADTRSLQADVTPEAAFAAIQRIGGATGWYYGNVAWRLRGWLDRLVGGPGLFRGRRDPERLAQGDVVDCWRVETVEPPRCLVLIAEMRLPGRAWLQFQVNTVEGGVEICQTARFDAEGFLGHVYWWVLYPAHQFMFPGMLRGIVRAARREMGLDHFPSGR